MGIRRENMKIFILVDGNNIIRCIASREENLHKDKLHMKKYHIKNQNFLIGDEYNPITGEIISHPENHLKPTKEEIRESKIQQEIWNIAEERLRARGEID
jgi:hypothetical protein